MEHLNTTYKGSVRQLLEHGYAKRFVQPYYTPLAFTLENTGIACGGLGNTYTMTLSGHTPVVNFISGYYAKEKKPGDIRLNNFFFRERVIRKDCFRLTVNNRHYFDIYKQFYEVVDNSGQKYIHGNESQAELDSVFARIIDDKNFYENNRQKITEWKIDLTARSRYFLNHPGLSYKQGNYYLLLDIFHESLKEDLNAEFSLTADTIGPGIKNIQCYPADNLYCEVLYPFQLMEYRSSSHVCEIKRLQYSPIIPGDEFWCSMPVSIIEFELYNPGDHDLDIGIMQVQENMCGFLLEKERSSLQDSCFLINKNFMHQINSFSKEVLGNNDPLAVLEFSQSPEYRLRGGFNGRHATGVTLHQPDEIDSVSCKPCFYTSAQEEIIASCLSSGLATSYAPLLHRTYTESLSGAVYANLFLKPKQTKTVTFAIVTDFPDIDLPGCRARDKYTSFYPDDKTRCTRILRKAVEEKDMLKEKVKNGQGTLCPENKLETFFRNNSSTGEKFRTMLLNNLSFLAENCIWNTENNFMVRECVDYPFFNSIDVYFFGSFSLMNLLPGLDRECVERFAASVFHTDDTIQRYNVYYYIERVVLPDESYQGKRALRGAVPHDMGSIFDMKPNAYIWSNVHKWKDLCPYLVLLVYRHYYFTKDRAFLEKCWAAMEEAVKYILKDLDTALYLPFTCNDHDTFDNLSTSGITVYGSSMWLAALKTMAVIAGILDNRQSFEQYRLIYCRAEENFRKILWDDEQGYYHYYSSPVLDSDIIASRKEELASCLGDLGIAFRSAETGDLAGAMNDYVYNHAIKPIPADRSIYDIYITDPDMRQKFAATADPDRMQNRIIKKIILHDKAGECLAASFRDKILVESDHVLGNQLCADISLGLLNIDPVTPVLRQKRILEKLVSTNFRIHSPSVGVSNLVTKEGNALDSFQAQDVWIGVQFSIITGLFMNNMTQDACNLADLLYTNLYERIKLPFAVPEGLNATFRITPASLQEELKLDAAYAEALFRQLSETGVLNENHRIDTIRFSHPELMAKIETCLDDTCRCTPGDVFRMLCSYSLQYTACQYFRPGMIHSLLFAQNQEPVPS